MAATLSTVPLATPYDSDMMTRTDDSEGMRLEEKALGKRCPVTLRRMAWGTAVSSSMMTA